MLVFSFCVEGKSQVKAGEHVRPDVFWVSLPYQTVCFRRHSWFVQLHLCVETSDPRTLGFPPTVGCDSKHGTTKGHICSNPTAICRTRADDGRPRLWGPPQRNPHGRSGFGRSLPLTVQLQGVLLSGDRDGLCCAWRPAGGKEKEPES